MAARRLTPALRGLLATASIRARMSSFLTRLVALAVALVVGGLAAGCGHKVGDACTTNVDCSPLGDRFCDVAAPGGYCTIEGCDVRANDSNDLVDSCQKVASESICIRFFTQQVAKDCNPSVSNTGCAADERCLCDVADPGNPGFCLPNETDGGRTAHCAKEASERRWCMLKCDKESDCRTQGNLQYKCVAAGTNGAEPVPKTLRSIDGGGPLIGFGDYTQKFCLYRPDRP